MIGQRIVTVFNQIVIELNRKTIIAQPSGSLECVQYTKHVIVLEYVLKYPFVVVVVYLSRIFVCISEKLI